MFPLHRWPKNYTEYMPTETKLTKERTTILTNELYLLVWFRFFSRSVVQYTETVYFYVQFFSRLDMHFSTVRYLIDSRRLMMESEKTTDGEGETTHPPSHSTGSIQNPCRQDQPGRFPSYRRANLFHALVFFLSVALRRRALAVASCRVYSS